MPLRSDLVGRSSEPLPARTARACALLEAAVAPGWRRNVRIPIGFGPLARPGCAVTGCRRAESGGVVVGGVQGAEQELDRGVNLLVGVHRVAPRLGR
jgi:hypothetical protein